MIMLLIPAGSIALVAILYLVANKKYLDYTDPLDNGKYPLKQLMCTGFLVMELIRYKYSTRYDRTLLQKISELNGAKYSYYYMQVHWANRITLLLFGMVLLSVIGAGLEPDPGFGVFSLIVIGIFTIIPDVELDKQVKKRRLLLRIDFPEFINKLTLLINAGMTTGRAWEKIVSDNKKHRPLYEELENTWTEIKGGKPEVHAFEDFAKRCRTPEITKFISVILQNMKKGNAELVSILRLQSAECWEMRKSTAKKLGEEASTKMLFPMMIMFLAILIIISVPAILSLAGVM